MRIKDADIKLKSGKLLYVEYTAHYCTETHSQGWEIDVLSWNHIDKNGEAYLDIVTNKEIEEIEDKLADLEWRLN